jgi:Uroporphyrinogen decarboxylase (URO-D)
MNSRERFHSVMRFEAPDTVPLPCLFQCFEAETIERWYREGLRRDAHVVEQFGFERMELVPVQLGTLPALERTDVEDSEEWRAGTDREHAGEATARVDAAREHFYLSEPGHWPAIRRRLNPASPARYPRFWQEYCRERADHEYPLGIQLTGPFSTLRDWMGLRRLAEAARTERPWIEEMLAELGDFLVQAARRAVTDLNLDFAIVREPWAYRADCVGSVEDFEKLFGRTYRQVIGFLRGAGIPAVVIQTKGRVTDHLGAWLANGANALAFVEAGAGMDGLALRREYGHDLALIGNLDHQVLACQWRDIADEVLAKVPALLSAGGYFPTTDRAVHSDVPLENYEYFLALLRRLGGEDTPRWKSHEKTHEWTIFPGPQPVGR